MTDKCGWVVRFGNSVEVEPCINSCRDFSCFSECQNTMTFSDACNMVADHYQEKADAWRNQTHPDALYWKEDD